MHVGRAVTRKNIILTCGLLLNDISFLKSKHYTLDTEVVIVGISSGCD